MSKADEKKELIALGKTDASRPLVIGRYVKDPLVMSDGSCDFSWRQYRFALVYQKTLDLTMACEASGMRRESAIYFLKKPQVKAWLDDRTQMDNVKKKWTLEGRWFAEVDKQYQKEFVPKHRVQILGMVKDFIPEASEKKQLTPTEVKISIAPETVMAIREREKAMEAELIKPTDSEPRGNSESRKNLT